MFLRLLHKFGVGSEIVGFVPFHSHFEIPLVDKWTSPAGCPWESATAKFAIPAIR